MNNQLNQIFHLGKLELFKYPMYSRELDEFNETNHTDSIYLYQSRDFRENGVKIIDQKCFKRLISLFEQMIKIQKDDIQIFILQKRRLKRNFTKGIESFGWWEDRTGLAGRFGHGEHFWNPLESFQTNKTQEVEAPNWAQIFFGQPLQG